MCVCVCVCVCVRVLQRQREKKGWNEGGAGIVCALQCDKMGVKWNSGFKKERGLDFGETRPSGSERGRETEGWRHGERESVCVGGWGL